jgi:hypothetical protein
LSALNDSGETVSWMIVFSDTVLAPTAVDSEGRLISAGPTSVEFLAYIEDFELDVQTNEIVRATMALQRSGPKNWDFPTADLP